MNKDKIINILIWFFALCPLILTIIYYDKMPDNIAYHYNINGVADGYSNKIVSFILPCVTIGIAILMKILNTKNSKNIVDLITLVIVLSFSILSLFLLYAQVKNITDFSQSSISLAGIIYIILGVMLTVTGNYMPKFRRNHFMGIRIPSTINSDIIWEKTHRLGGKMFVIGGIIFILLGIFGENFVYSNYVVLFDIFIIAVVPIGYAMYLDRENIFKKR